MSPTRLMQPITLDGLLAAQDEIQRQSTARTPPVRMRIHPDLRQHLVDQLAPGKTPTFTSINSIPVEDDPSLPEGALELDPAEGRSPAMVFICRRGRPRTPPCSSCGDFYAPLLCDWKIGLDKKKTCDRALCARDAYPVPGKKDKHWCPPHRRMHEAAEKA